MIIKITFEKKFNLNCAPEGSRTPNPQLRRLMLYPVELLAQLMIKNTKILLKKQLITQNIREIEL